MKKMFVLILALVLCVQMAACSGAASTDSSPVPSSSEPENWGTMTEENAQAADVTQEPENEFGTLGVEAPPQDDETIAELKEIILALIMCDFADGMQYNPTDSMFFWRAMNYYAASVCYSYEALSEDMSWAVFSEDQLLYFAKRLFGGVESLPELLDTGMIEKLESGEYAFMLGNYGDVLLELGEIQSGENDTFTVSANLVSGAESESLGNWQIRLIQIDGEYCVSGIVYG